MVARIYLSRHNILTLLAKLDRKKAGEDTFCTLVKRDNKHPHFPQTMSECVVTAVEDEEYYSHRQPGPTAEDKEYLNWLKNLE